MASLPLPPFPPPNRFCKLLGSIFLILKPLPIFLNGLKFLNILFRLNPLNILLISSLGSLSLGNFNILDRFGILILLKLNPLNILLKLGICILGNLKLGILKPLPIFLNGFRLLNILEKLGICILGILLVIPFHILPISKPLNLLVIPFNMLDISNALLLLLGTFAPGSVSALAVGISESSNLAAAPIGVVSSFALASFFNVFVQLLPFLPFVLLGLGLFLPFKIFSSCLLSLIFSAKSLASPLSSPNNCPRAISWSTFFRASLKVMPFFILALMALATDFSSFLPLNLPLLPRLAISSFALVIALSCGVSPFSSK